jgi:hypothetical protein
LVWGQRAPRRDAPRAPSRQAVAGRSSHRRRRTACAQWVWSRRFASHSGPRSTETQRTHKAAECRRARDQTTRLPPVQPTTQAPGQPTTWPPVQPTTRQPRTVAAILPTRTRPSNPARHSRRARRGQQGRRGRQGQRGQARGRTSRCDSCGLDARSDLTVHCDVGSKGASISSAQISTSRPDRSY